MAKAGRPKGARNKAIEFIRPIAQRNGPECIEVLMRLVRNPKVKPSDKKACAELVLAYGFGKPKESLEFSGPGGTQLQFVPPVINIRFGDSQ